MSEDMNKKLKQITDILGQENMPENLKGLLNMLASSPPKPDKAQNSGAFNPSREEKSSPNELDENLEMVRKVKTIYDKMRSADDPRINLLNAISPFLGSNRQKKLSNCIKMLHMTSLSKFMDETGQGLF